jgi:hypothetical protein
MTHSPAPWRTSDEGEYILVFADAAKDYVASVHNYDSTGRSFPDGVADANAALIAAAPDLLKHLIVMTDHIELTVEGFDDWVSNRIRAKMNEARAAIAKATGAAA